MSTIEVSENIKINQEDIEPISHSMLDRHFKKLWENRTKTSMMLWGRSGIGKTDRVLNFGRAQAKAMGKEFSVSYKDINNENKFVCLVVVLHHFEGAEVKGFPVPNKELTQIDYIPISMFPQKGPGIMFLDEMNLAHADVLNNAYQFLQERRVGLYELPPDFMVLGAGNMGDDGGNTTEMPGPLNNRMKHYQLIEPTGKEWCDWAIMNGVDHRIIAFIKFDSKWLNTWNPKAPIQQKAFATARSWYKAGLDIANENPTTPEDFLFVQQLVAGHVGSALGREFIGWLELSQQFDIPKIMAGGSFDIPKKVDVLYSLISALTGYYKQNATEKTAGQIARVAKQFKQDHTVLILSTLKYMDKQFFKKWRAADEPLFDEMTDKVFHLLTGN